MAFRSALPQDSPADSVRMLAPFILWCGIAGGLVLWGWPYRFEAYLRRQSGSSGTTRCGAGRDRLIGWR